MGLRKQLHETGRYLFIALWLCHSGLCFSLTHAISRIRLADQDLHTSEGWLREFLELSLPTHLTDEELSILEQKLLTTQVFSDVRLTPESDGTLRVILEEKWTLIPVVRGQFGGGTPLLVMGARDTHGFGRLWNMGAEVRQYGSAPMGYVLYAKSPRAFGGNYHLGMEFWQEHRIWGLWEGTRSLGQMYLKGQQLRLEFLAPLWGSKLERVQMGLDLNYKNQGTQYSGSLEAPVFQGVLLSSPEKKSLEVWPTFVMDDLLVTSPTGFSGKRVVGKWGLIHREDEPLQQALELKLYVYVMFGEWFTFASQSFLGLKDSPYYTEQYVLGGFDTVRGLPDGQIFGSKTFYTNLEWLTRVAALPYAFVQHAVFLDAGTAGDKKSELMANQRYSLGTGLRFASPQIQKFVMRFDLARSVGKGDSWGLSVGMSSFFHPYPSMSQ